jgi:hypothetical protein
MSRLSAPRSSRLAGSVALGTGCSVLAWLITSHVLVGIAVFLLINSLIFVAPLLLQKPVHYISLHRALFSYGIRELYPNQGTAHPRICSLLENTANVDILTIRGLGMFALTDSLMRATLVRRRSQLHVRALLLAPNSRHAAQRAVDVGDQADTMAAGIKLAEQALAEMTQLGVHVALRYYDRRPVFRFMFLDGHLFMSGFIPAIEGNEFPLLEVEQVGPRGLFTLARWHFDELWESATERALISPQQVRLSPDAVERVRRTRAPKTKSRHDDV